MDCRSQYRWKFDYFLLYSITNFLSIVSSRAASSVDKEPNIIISLFDRKIVGLMNYLEYTQKTTCISLHLRNFLNDYKILKISV